MKTLFVLEMSLLASKEGKAKRIVFDKRRTLIHGKNGTGKSSLIKSIYRTFGAEPLLNATFAKSNAISLVKFEVDGTIYSILREGKKYAIYDEEGLMIQRFESVVNELGPFLADLFDFKPSFQTIEGEYVQPPPAYLFLPYYIDQDESWTKSWGSFQQLAWIKNYRNECINYHSGIRPNEYFTTRNEIQSFDEIITDATKERQVTDKLLADVRSQLSQTDFNIDLDKFKTEIENLLLKLEKLKQAQHKYKHRLIDLHNQSATLKAQIEIVKEAQIETKNDMNFAVKELPSVVECPTCGAEYNNSFAERFELARDVQKSLDLLIDLRNELEEVEGEIKSVNESLTRKNIEVQEVENLLDRKKGDLVLKDVIENAGKNQVKDYFQERSKELLRIISENTYQKEQLAARLRSFESREKRQEINAFFYSKMRDFLSQLGVNTLSPEFFEQVTDTKVEARETGSARPRSLIAYYFTFFHLMRKFSSSVYCPLIIDSPNQQDQDMENVDKILEFINHRQPENTQIILGLSETFGINFNCPTIELTEKAGLLQKNEFREVEAIFQPFLEQLWFNQQGFF